jgi:Cu2+-exporting ATPase
MKSSTALKAPETLDGYDGLVTTSPESLQNLLLLVSGVHCAACIQKIESALLSQPDVQGARLNFSTGRLNIIWRGTQDRANDFAALVQSLGYAVRPYCTDAAGEEAENENRFLLMCLGVAGFASGNIMLLSVGLWVTDGQTMGLATRELLHWVSALIAIPTVMFSGQPFFRSGLGALKRGQTNMDVPISVALILATGMSLFETVRGGEHAYFDSAVMLMFLLLIGRVLDFRARKSARSAATNLMQTFSGFASVLENGKIRKIPIRDLREGQIVSVAAGEKIPVDGMVQIGESSIDTSLVTGETLPRPVKPGEAAYAGTINLSASLTIKISKAAEDSLLADIVRLMEKAEQGQARYVRLADRVSKLYTPVVHTLAALGFLLWWLVLGAAWQDALMIAVTVLIITCPCALGLAVPVVQVLGSGVLMKRGILLKSGDALERLAGIDTVLLDKTGTLTLGRPALLGTYNADDLHLVASLARHSKHPLSTALADAFNGDVLDVDNIKEYAGQGLGALYNGKIIKLGSRLWCGNPNAPGHNETELWLAVEGQEPVCFLFSDRLRGDAKETILALQKKGLRTILLSGDRIAVAQKIAKECGIDEAYGELTPVQKFERLQNLKDKGHKILMVGDGLNDAPTLAGADISMAPGTAIDMAQSAADIVFMGEGLSPVNAAHTLAVKSQALVKQNFALAILYNVVAIPLAFCGMVTPFVAALAMSGSSLFVIANSFRLRGIK